MTVKLRVILKPVQILTFRVRRHRSPRTFVQGGTVSESTGVPKMPGRLDDIRLRQREIEASLSDLESAEDNEENRLRADALLDEFSTLETESTPLVERAAAIS